jgi:glycosyltransferase involved in cell wall biosynthesis
MPVQDAASTVALAVRSIMVQSFPDWELLVLDDGSKDRTVDTVLRAARDDPRVRVHADGERLGLSARLNAAIDMARGQLIARMDGDDISYPTRLEAQVSYLRAHPEVDLVGTGTMVFRSDGTPLGRRVFQGDHREITAHPLRGFPLSHPTWMGRRTWFAAHRYNAGAVRCEDQELLLRAYLSSRYAAIPDILLGYREDRIKVQANLSSRLHYSIACLQHSRSAKATWRGTMAAVVHAAKGLVEVVAVASHLEHRMLGHRARPASARELESWSKVWSELAAG